MDQQIVQHQSKRKDIVACLHCNKNHKKCDGNRPCNNCVRRKMDCIENPKRKAFGRPTRNDDDKVDKKIKVIEIICVKCKTNQELTSKFCTQCGNKMPENIIQNDLQKENEMLRKKNEELMSIITQISNFTAPQLWMLSKLYYPRVEGKMIHPCPSFIIDASPAFLNLLGYPCLKNFYYPNLIPSHHHVEIPDEKFNMTVCIERIEGLSTPKMTCKKYHVYLKHINGTFMRVAIEITNYFDDQSGYPTFSMMYIERILEANLSENQIPPYYYSYPHEVKFVTDTQQELPTLIKKFRCMSLPKENFLEISNVETSNQEIISNQDHSLTFSQEFTLSTFESVNKDLNVSINNLRFSNNLVIPLDSTLPFENLDMDNNNFNFF